MIHQPPSITRLIALCAFLGASCTVLADTPTDKIDAGVSPTKHLLLLMDTDKNGKVSKDEFMKFMDAEFERLDLNHDGELDVKELTQLRVRPIYNTRR